MTQNDGEDARSTVVKLTCGSYTVEVTVTQDSKEPDLSLKVGQSVDDGIGMIFWVRDGICLHVMSYGSCLMFTTVLDMLIRILLRLYLIS